MAHYGSFGMNISIKAMNILTANISGVSNAFQNKNVPIHERVCVSSPPYYLGLFEIFYPNVTLNRDDGSFFIQCIKVIQGTKPSLLQYNRIFDAVVTILECKKIAIDNSIYIKVFSDGTISYLEFSTGDFVNTTNNYTSFPEIRRVFEEFFYIKV